MFKDCIVPSAQYHQAMTVAQLSCAVRRVVSLLSQEHSRILVTSRDTPTNAAAVVAAYIMSAKAWSASVALGYLLSKQVDLSWPPEQLQVLYSFRLSNSDVTARATVPQQLKSSWDLAFVAFHRSCELCHSRINRPEFYQCVTTQPLFNSEPARCDTRLVSQHCGSSVVNSRRQLTQTDPHVVTTETVPELPILRECLQYADDTISIDTCPANFRCATSCLTSLSVTGLPDARYLQTLNTLLPLVWRSPRSSSAKTTAQQDVQRVFLDTLLEWTLKYISSNNRDASLSCAHEQLSRETLDVATTMDRSSLPADLIERVSRLVLQHAIVYGSTSVTYCIQLVPHLIDVSQERTHEEQALRAVCMTLCALWVATRAQDGSSFPASPLFKLPDAVSPATEDFFRLCRPWLERFPDEDVASSPRLTSLLKNPGQLMRGFLFYSQLTRSFFDFLKSDGGVVDP